MTEYWLYVEMAHCSTMHFVGDCSANNQYEADNAAWECAVEEYESFAGYHGLLTRDEIYDELRTEFGDDVEEEDVDCRYAEEVNDHVAYWAVPAREDIDPEDEDFMEDLKRGEVE